jgi:transcription initiation factor TFIIH subunit 2
LTTITIGPSIMANSADCDRCCFGCLKIIGCKPINDTTNGLIYGGKDVMGNKEAILRFQCPDCHNVFCPDCDAFLHETLHNCPGCLCYN